MQSWIDCRVASSFTHRTLKHTVFLTPLCGKQAATAAPGGAGEDEGSALLSAQEQEESLIDVSANSSPGGNTRVKDLLMLHVHGLQKRGQPPADVLALLLPVVTFWQAASSSTALTTERQQSAGDASARTGA